MITMNFRTDRGAKRALDALADACDYDELAEAMSELIGMPKTAFVAPIIDILSGTGTRCVLDLESSKRWQSYTPADVKYREEMRAELITAARQKLRRRGDSEVHVLDFLGLTVEVWHVQGLARVDVKTPCACTELVEEIDCAWCGNRGLLHEH
jgi:hypothetical protein